MTDLNVDDPWDWMQPEDAARWGDVIFDRDEQKRWCQAVFLGGLGYMWRKAAVPRQLIFDKLALKPGGKVLVLGEALEACGFIDEFRSHVGPDGEVQVVEIMEEARQAYFSGHIGRGGQLATWKYEYTNDIEDDYFDGIAVIQGVQHTDDWKEAGAELVRVLKPGGKIFLAEICFGPPMMAKVELDMHIEYLITKIFKRFPFTLEEIPYYSIKELEDAFSDVLEATDSFAWKDIEMFWGRKP